MTVPAAETGMNCGTYAGGNFYFHFGFVNCVKLGSARVQKDVDSMYAKMTLHTSNSKQLLWGPRAVQKCSLIMWKFCTTFYAWILMVELMNNLNTLKIK